MDEKLLRQMVKDNGNFGFYLRPVPDGDLAVMSGYRMLIIPAEKEIVETVRALGGNDTVSKSTVDFIVSEERPNDSWISGKEFLDNLKNFRARYRESEGVYPQCVLYCVVGKVWVNAKFLKQAIENLGLRGFICIKSGDPKIPIEISDTFGSYYVCGVVCNKNGNPGDFIRIL